MRILEPLFILIACLLLFLTIPYFPYALSVIFSIVIAGFAFKMRTAAVVLMFALAMPGYIYQGEFPWLVLGIAGGTLFIVSATCIGAPGTALGVASGAVAAMLMFTPAYFLSIPLVIGVALFRTRGIKVGVTEAILVFLAFYLPFIVPADRVIDPTSGMAPLFGQVDFASKSPVPVVELSEMFDQLKDSISGHDNIFFDNIGIYWPIEGSGRLLGFILLFSLIGSIFVAFFALSMIEWFRQRIEEYKYFNWMAPTIALLAANLAFLLPIMLLKTSFIYEVDLGPLTIFGFLVATVAIGNGGSAIDYWLTRHERLLDLRSRLDRIMAELEETKAETKKQINDVKSVCPTIDLFAEESVLVQCEQEMAFISANIEIMDTETMNEKLGLLSRLNESIFDARHQISGKLLVYIDDTRHSYRDLMSQALQYGFVFDKGVIGHFSKQHFPDEEAALEEQSKLNDKFEEVSHILITSGTDIGQIVKEEVDSEFVNISMDVAQNLFMAGSYPEAIEAALSSMATAERLVNGATSDLASELDATIKRLQEMIRNSLVPAIEATNDPNLASSLNAEFVKLEKLRFPAQPGRKLVDRLQVVKATRELFQWTNNVIEQLFRKINALEEEVDSMVPSGYSWGKSDFVPPDTRELAEIRNIKPGRTTLDDSMEAIKIAIQVIEEEATIIKHHMEVREFVINYPNIEYLLDEKMKIQGTVNLDELPVRENYAMRYLQLYAMKHYRRVTFDSKSGVLSYRED
ncbi:MAG: hypothetical protein R6U37_03275 [Dehalococcoidia bacterium]